MMEICWPLPQIPDKEVAVDSIYKDPVVDLVKDKLEGENLSTYSLLGSYHLC